MWCVIINTGEGASVGNAIALVGEHFYGCFFVVDSKNSKPDAKEQDCTILCGCKPEIANIIGAQVIKKEADRPIVHGYEGEKEARKAMLGFVYKVDNGNQRAGP